MSNLTRLQAVSSSLDTAIGKANSLPNAGSGGGGGSVETCTVTIDTTQGTNAAQFQTILYVTVNNGQMVVNGMTNFSNRYLITLSNVVCGSLVVVQFYSTISATTYEWETVNTGDMGFDNVLGLYLLAPSIVGTNGTATLVKRDSGGMPEGPPEL
jgi:hypothetical protein